MADNLLILQRQAHQGQPHFVQTGPLPANAPSARDGQYQQAPSEEKMPEHPHLADSPASTGRDSKLHQLVLSTCSAEAGFDAALS